MGTLLPLTFGGEEIIQMICIVVYFCIIQSVFVLFMKMRGLSQSMVRVVHDQPYPNPSPKHRRQQLLDRVVDPIAIETK